jgi:hypothetical protein
MLLFFGKGFSIFDLPKLDRRESGNPGNIRTEFVIRDRYFFLEARALKAIKTVILLPTVRISAKHRD